MHDIINVNVKGVVNDTTAHAQKCDVYMRDNRDNREINVPEAVVVYSESVRS